MKAKKIKARYFINVLNLMPSETFNWLNAFQLISNQTKIERMRKQTLKPELIVFVDMDVLKIISALNIPKTVNRLVDLSRNFLNDKGFSTPSLSECIRRMYFIQCRLNYL